MMTRCVLSLRVMLRIPTNNSQDIYQRSVNLEGSSSGPLDFGKKKLPWFQKEK